MATGPYIGLTTDIGPSAIASPNAVNSYTEMGRYPQALYVVRGTVLAGFQSTQYYDVATDFGRFMALSLGSGHGRLGVNEAGGYLPGEQVLVAVSPSQPAFNAVIIGRADYAKAGQYTPPCPLLVYPQVAGYEYAARMSGQQYSDFPRLRNFNSGILDVVDGDHVLHNMFGGAIGAEQFRTYLQASPAAGIFCYGEDSHTKLVGARFERITFSEEFEDRQLGVGLVQVGRRVWYPGDALSEKQPQQLHLNGPVHGGGHEYRTYPDNANDASFNGESRVALLHEYRGVDGSYVMSSAASIILQKTLDVPMPVEVIEADYDPQAACDPVDVDADLKARNVDTGATYTEATKDLRIANTQSANPLTLAMNARGLADKLISWQARGGIDRLNQWKINSTPQAVFGGKEPKDLLMSKDPSMWKCMPQSFVLSLDPYGTTKRYYYGRAMVAITEDGSVVFQDAQGSQIMLSGGNIYLTAQHDIVSYAGRNSLQMAGRDVAVRGARHCDLAAEEGRLTAMATQQATLMGGLDGHSGVLVESRGRYHGTVDTGENPATSGGLVLKSQYYVGLDGSHVDIRARDERGTIQLDAGDAVLWRAKNGQNFGCFGATISANLAGDTEIVLGNVSTFRGRGLWVQGNIFYEGLKFSKSAANSGGAWAYRSEVIIGDATESEVHDKLMGFANHPFDVSVFRAKWLSSEQYTIKSATYFTIPEPEWMIRMKQVANPNSAILRATLQDNFVDGSAPFPGFQAMIGYGMTELGNSGAPPDFGENYEEDFSVTPGVPIQGSLLKGI